MVGATFTVLPVLLGLTVLGLMLVLVPRRRRLVAINEHAHPGLAALRAKTTWARVLGLILGVGAAAGVAALDTAWTRLGRGLLVAPLVFAGTLIVVLSAGDLAAHRDARTASDGPRAGAVTEHRRASQFLPPAISAAVAAAGAIFIVLLTLAWAWGSPDDAGRPGRSFTTGSPDGRFTSISGPWPGQFYAVPAFVGVGILTVLTAAALLVIIRRPRDGSDAEIARVDGIVRRREAESLVAAAGLGLSISATGVGLEMARILLSERPGARLNGYTLSRWYDIAGWSALVLALLYVGIGLWCAVVLLAPGASAPRGPRTASVTSAQRIEGEPT
ncbi:hypothetical protein [Gephyromycinifex aptenodytis]|uniref:hypothetical protein n=1 Tax=Gephyromycinifex aptenodytis TaxID=2716227 RepID=UPI001444EEEC|nr:hypothetical protein [Gephyromycinifex aptenodytis]